MNERQRRIVQNILECSTQVSYRAALGVPGQLSFAWKNGPNRNTKSPKGVISNRVITKLSPKRLAQIGKQADELKATAGMRPPQPNEKSRQARPPVPVQPMAVEPSTDAVAPGHVDQSMAVEPSTDAVAPEHVEVAPGHVDQSMAVEPSTDAVAPEHVEVAPGHVDQSMAVEPSTDVNEPLTNAGPPVPVHEDAVLAARLLSRGAFNAVLPSQFLSALIQPNETQSWNLTLLNMYPEWLDAVTKLQEYYARIFSETVTREMEVSPRFPRRCSLSTIEDLSSVFRAYQDTVTEQEERQVFDEVHQCLQKYGDMNAAWHLQNPPDELTPVEDYIRPRLDFKVIPLRIDLTAMDDAT